MKLVLFTSQLNDTLRKGETFHISRPWFSHDSFTCFEIGQYFGKITETLEKTEGVIQNGQLRETGNIGHTRHRTKTK